jgi:hypothetical protein
MINAEAIFMDLLNPVEIFQFRKTLKLLVGTNDVFYAFRDYRVKEQWQI